MLHLFIVTVRLEISRRLVFFEPGLEYCLGGPDSVFLFWQILYVGPAAVAVVLCAGVSEGNYEFNLLCG